MAIFGSKKNSEVKKTIAKPAKVTSDQKKEEKTAPKAKTVESFGVLKNPRITEKATFVSEQNVYTFDVATTANERMVKQAVKENYGVIPTKVNLLNVRGKLVYSRGKQGRKAAGKKAYVYLKKGDKIEFA